MGCDAATVRQLLPETVDEIDPVAAYAADARPAQPGRPWVLVNMVTSVDGATAVDGRSGPLGGPADKAVFAAIRSVADAVVVGAATVRAERYGPAKPRGDRPAPRIAVVTASGDLAPDLRLFTAAPPDQPPPLVVTCEACPPARRVALAAIAEVVVAGEERVDLALALTELAERGVGVAVAEGGPTLNGQLVAAGLVDEWCASIAPCLVAGASPRAAVGTEPVGGPLVMRLDRLLIEDGLCFARYLRVSEASTGR